MRISDWSSDVCSSDLFTLRAALGLTMPTWSRLAGAQRKRAVGWGRVWRRAEAREVGLRKRPDVRRYVPPSAAAHRHTRPAYRMPGCMSVQRAPLHADNLTWNSAHRRERRRVGERD